MFELDVKNQNNQVLKLTQNPAYTLFLVDGLTPPTANINMSSSALIDGAVYNSSKANNRNIVLNFTIENPAEANRIALYRFFKPKMPIFLHCKNGVRDVTVQGYVENMDISIFEKKQTAQASIICPSAYLPATTFESETYGGMDPYTMTLDNVGDVPVGIQLNASISSAVHDFVITNQTTNKAFRLNYSFTDSGILSFSSLTGHKTCTFRTNSETVNMINYIDLSSDWLELAPGQNTIVISATSGINSINGTLVFRPLFEGV